jgi:hypothetical protein
MMNTHKFLLRLFRNGFVPQNGAVPHHSDEVVCLIREEECVFRYTSLQQLWIPRFVLHSPTPQWGFILDNSSEVQKTFPVLAIEINVDKQDIDVFQWKKTLDLMSELRVHAQTNSNLGDVNVNEPEGRPETWSFDHWSCFNR